MSSFWRCAHGCAYKGPVINPFELPARIFLYVALMLLVGLPTGLATTVLPVLRRANIDARPVYAHARCWLAVASALLIAGAVAMFVAQLVPLELEYTTLSEWMDFVWLSLLGQMLMVRVGLGLAAVLAVWLLPAPNTRHIACVVVGLLAQATITRTSHTTAMANGWLPVASDYAHLAAGALWGGGLVAVWVALWVWQRHSTDAGSVPITRGLIQRFAPVGIAGVALATGTGLVLSAQHVPSADALRAGGYGAILLIKVGVVAASTALAGLHRFVTRQRLRTETDVRRFVRTLSLEMALVCGVFVCAAALTSTPPPHRMMTHAMEDGTTMVMEMTNPEFERSLQIAALAAIVAGGIALVLEWRLRSTQHT